MVILGVELDTTEPAIAALTPDNGTPDVSPSTSQVIIEFTEAVTKGVGDLTVKLASDDSTVMTIPVTDPGVLVADAVVTIPLPAALAASTGYYLNIAPGAFEDLAGNNFAGITDSLTWAFTTGVADVLPPEVAALIPENGSDTLYPTANLSITYNEPIFVGSGSLTLKHLSDDSVVATMPVPGADISISGPTATINPPVDLEFGTAYYVEVAAGTFTDAESNATVAITGSSVWSFATRSLSPILISQYYEGDSQNRFIELKNTTASPVLLDGYSLAAWSDTPPSDNEGWKSGSGTTDRVTALLGFEIPANGSFLIASSAATAPGYAVSNNDLSANSGTVAFDGDDSIVLYFHGDDPLGFTLDEVVDAVSFAGNDGMDTSFHRVSDGPGFDFNPGTSILDYSGVWANQTIAAVDAASPTDDWYLKASVEAGTFVLSFDPPTISESAGAAAVTATVTRSGDTTDALFVLVESSNPAVAEESSGLGFVEIPAGQGSAPFTIDVFDNPWALGDTLVTFTLTATGYVPTSEVLSVLDDLTDEEFPVVINEIDADQPSTDSAEFIELYNNSSSPQSLDGMVIVLFNGNGDVSYNVIDLVGQTIPANGFFVIGSENVPNVDLPVFTTDSLQNGADAVALIAGSAADFPNGTSVTSIPGILVDALVYGTNDADDTGLLDALTPGGIQANETPNGDDALARVPDGGAAFASGSFVAQTPTPGATNILPVGGDFATWAAANGITGELFDGDFDGDGIPNGVEYAIEGLDPTSPDSLAGAFDGTTLSFTKRPDAVANGDVLYLIEESTDLGVTDDWSEVAAGPAYGNDATTISYELPTGVAGGRIFARLRIAEFAVAE